MIYVSDRNADSICDTALLFLVMNSEYMPNHLVGCDSTSVAFCVASLIIFAVAPVSGWFSRWLDPRTWAGGGRMRWGLARDRTNGVKSSRVAAEVPAPPDPTANTRNQVMNHVTARFAVVATAICVDNDNAAHYRVDCCSDNSIPVAA